MTTVVYKLHRLPVKYRIEYKIILITYQALNGLAPNYLRDLLQFYQPARSLQPSGDLRLMVPPTRLRSYGDRTFSVKVPSLWNSLPLQCHRCPHLRNCIYQMAFADV